MAHVLFAQGANDHPLAGAHRPRLGQHVLQADGGTTQLCGGLAAVWGEQRRRLKAGATWCAHFEHPLTGPAAGVLDAQEVLRMYDAARDVLRNAAGGSSVPRCCADGG